MTTNVRRNSKLLKFFAIALLVPIMLVTACEELGIGKESEYNVFYIPDGQGSGQKPVFVGKTKGLRSCRQLASMRRQQANKVRKDHDYICCLITKESVCAEKKE